MEWAREMSGKFSHIFGEDLLRTSYGNTGVMNPEIMKPSEKPPHLGARTTGLEITGKSEKPPDLLPATIFLE